MISVSRPVSIFWRSLTRTNKAVLPVVSFSSAVLNDGPLWSVSNLFVSSPVNLDPIDVELLSGFSGFDTADKTKARQHLWETFVFAQHVEVFKSNKISKNFTHGPLRKDYVVDSSIGMSLLGQYLKLIGEYFIATQKL